MTPSPHFLHDYLRSVGQQRGADDPEFANAVILRLEHGGREYADNYRSRPLQDFFYEVRDEGADITGWLALALDVIFELERSGQIDPDLAQLARVKVMNLAAVGQYVWREATDFLDLLGPGSS